MVSLSMTLSDPWPGFQGHGSFKRRISTKRRILQTQSLYRTLIGNHRQAIDRQASYIQLTNPLLLHKPCKRFASVARVCQRQLAFLVKIGQIEMHCGQPTHFLGGVGGQILAPIASPCFCPSSFNVSFCSGTSQHNPLSQLHRYVA